MLRGENRFSAGVWNSSSSSSWSSLFLLLLLLLVGVGGNRPLFVLVGEENDNDILVGMVNRMLSYALDLMALLQ